MNKEMAISILDSLLLKSKSQGLNAHDREVVSSLKVWLKKEEIKTIIANLSLKSKSQGLSNYERNLLNSLRLFWLKLNKVEVENKQNKIEGQSKENLSALELKLI